MSKIINQLKKGSILLLGFGAEGRDTLDFLKSRFPNKKIGVADKKQKDIDRAGVRAHFGDDYISSIKEYDVIIKSPGVPFSLIKNKIKNKIITSQTDIFLSKRSFDTIGVTGTKGKSTTCLCIYNILKKQLDKDVYLLGNIGEPVLDYINKEGLFIYELSSFQLQTTTVSPRVAIFLNLFKDHLDQHASFREYINSKVNIFKYQSESDILIYNEDDLRVSELVSKTESKKIPFSSELKISGTPVYLEPILEAAKLFNVKKRIAQDCIDDVDFLPHRMEDCGTYEGVKFINDSAATIPEAVVEAIDSLDGLKTLIAGGVDKGGDYRKLAKKIAKSNVETLILFPDTGEKIKKDLRKITDDLPEIIDSESMNHAVRAAYKKTDNGTCLMSPASSSFNMFSSYKHRGNEFRKYVKKYGKE